MKFENTKLAEFNKNLENKKVAVIGLGVSNLPLLDFLFDKNCKVTIFDENSEEKMDKEIVKKIIKYKYKFYFGKDSLLNLNGYDIIFRSPSCLPTKNELESEINNGAEVITEVEKLIELAPCKIIGVTGSDGKTTTTTLIYKILTSAGYNCFLGGNIGIPIFTKLSQINPDDIIILELSSFQLINMKKSPDISVITNITPNHLNVHKDFLEYINSKKNIFKNQNKDGIIVLNYDNDITKKCGEEALGKVIYFSSKQKLDNGYIIDNYIIKKSNDKINKHIIDTKNIKLRGMHNFENICAALAVTQEFVDEEDAIEYIKDFPGVEHRLEFVRELDGVKWYNDSVSSSPTRTIAGLNSFDEDIVLIAGGYDKKLDYTPISKPIVQKVKTLILIGQTSGKIFDCVKKEMEIRNKKIDIYMCDSLEKSIDLARRCAVSNQVVLFSPASASFDMFKDFADRGRMFKKLVNQQK